MPKTKRRKTVTPHNVGSLLFDHVVVLMLENRSFDHLFGYLGLGEGLNKAPYTNYLRADDSTTTAFSTKMGGDYTASGEGPSHSLKQVNEQLFGSTKVAANIDAGRANLSGFVSSLVTALTYDLKRTPTTSELQEAMNCFDPVQLPVLSTLARSFVLCDHWFADVPGPTMPNRAYVHAATSQGYTYNANWKPQFSCKTIYDRINATPSRSWRVYYHDQNDVLELYPTLTKTPQNNALFENTFFADVAGDSLASYSFITPAFIGTPDQPVNSMHAPADVRPAEKLVADV
jgi:phospholipase C